MPPCQTWPLASRRAQQPLPQPMRLRQCFRSPTHRNQGGRGALSALRASKAQPLNAMKERQCRGCKHVSIILKNESFEHVQLGRPVISYTGLLCQSPTNQQRRSPSNDAIQCTWNSVKQLGHRINRTNRTNRQRHRRVVVGRGSAGMAGSSGCRSGGCLAWQGLSRAYSAQGRGKFLVVRTPWSGHAVFMSHSGQDMQWSWHTAVRTCSGQASIQFSEHPVRASVLARIVPFARAYLKLVERTV